MRLFHRRLLSRALAILCGILLVHSEAFLYAQQEADVAAPNQADLAPGKLDSLVAPIALYPDPLLAQILAAATYPLEVVEAQRWLQSNSKLKGGKLVHTAAEQDWDPSIQALVVFPEVLDRMSQHLQWTTALGNAFLAQQSDVMAAVQRMRTKAYQAGRIMSNAQQTVSVKTVDGESVIVIEPATPQVVYVPTYNPAVLFGPATAYPYPVMEYPSSGALFAANAISFGAGIALGAAFEGCCGYAGWGWGCDWGNVSSVTVNNNFFGRYGYATPYARGVYGTTAWKHNPAYRGGVPYSSAAVAGKYGYGRAVSTPYGSAARVDTRYGDAAGVRTPYGSAERFERSSSDWAGSRSFGSGAWGGWDGGWARAASDRGFSSLRSSGWGGGRFGGGGLGGGRFGGFGGGRFGGGRRR